MRLLSTEWGPSKPQLMNSGQSKCNDYGKGTIKNPAYGRHQLSRPMRIVGPIQIWKGCVIYLLKNKNKKNNNKKNQATKKLNKMKI